MTTYQGKNRLPAENLVERTARAQVLAMDLAVSLNHSLMAGVEVRVRYANGFTRVAVVQGTRTAVVDVEGEPFATTITAGLRNAVGML